MLSFFSRLIIVIIFIACEQSANNKTRRKDSIKNLQTQQTIKIKENKEKKTMNYPSDPTIEKVKYETSNLENSEGNLKKILSKMQNGDSVKIVCYGNSITNGYKIGSYDKVANPYPEVLGNLLRNKYNNLKITLVNEGHNGWRSDQAALNAGKLVVEKKPDLVILKFGINDIYSGFTSAVFEQKMTNLVIELRQNKCEVLLLSPTPINTFYNKQVLKYFPLLKNIAETHKTAFFNLHKALIQRAEKENLSLSKILPDDVHFADDKYAWIAEEIFSFLLNLDKE